MNEDELRAIIARGEDSQHQFKRDFTNVDVLAAELIALANSMGGQLFVDVADGGQVTGLTPEDVTRLNQLLPDKPRSSKQRYHLTEQGMALLSEQKNKELKP